MNTWLYVSGLDVLGQSHRHDICAFIELPCYLNCFIKIAYIMLYKFSDSDSDSVRQKLYSVLIHNLLHFYYFAIIILI